MGPDKLPADSLMKLHEPTLANKLGKRLAVPLSRIVCSHFFYKPARVLDAYLNFLMGKGSGTGWDLRSEVGAAIANIKRPTPVLFDIGANLGEWTEAALEKIPGAKVFLFDPSPGCQAVIKKKNLHNSTLIPAGAGEQNGIMPFHFRDPTDGSASLHVRHDTVFANDQYRTIKVEIRTIDEVMESYGLNFVDFIKMDIEGHEIFALRGAVKAFASRRIGALSFEFGAGNINSHTYFREFWELLTGHGFALWRVTPGGKLIPVTEYYEDLEYFRGVTNYIAALKNA